MRITLRPFLAIFYFGTLNAEWASLTLESELLLSIFTSLDFTPQAA